MSTEELTRKVKEKIQQELNFSGYSTAASREKKDSFSVMASSPEVLFPKTDNSIQVQIHEQNRALFRLKGYLFLDSNAQNVYTGNPEKNQNWNTRDIRRKGAGVFSYDGFSFRFEYTGGTEIFALENLNYISFYPNCLVLIPKNNLPSVLVFLPETESIRKILETFKTDK